jgi:small GTP-binding protein
MAEKETAKFKICLLGDGAVGKTSLIGRYVYDEFDEKYLLTLGTKTSMKEIPMVLDSGEDLMCSLMIWDIMGQKEFERLHKTFFAGTQGAIIVTDVTRKETLYSVEDWIQKLFDVSGEVPLVFVMNKCDLMDRAQFKKEEMKSYSKRFNTEIYQTSAKTGANVEDLFLELGILLVEKNTGKEVVDPIPKPRDSMESASTQIAPAPAAPETTPVETETAPVETETAPELAPVDTETDPVEAEAAPELTPVQPVEEEVQPITTPDPPQPESEPQNPGVDPSVVLRMQESIDTLTGSIKHLQTQMMALETTVASLAIAEQEKAESTKKEAAAPKDVQEDAFSQAAPVQQQEQAKPSQTPQQQAFSQPAAQQAAQPKQLDPFAQPSAQAQPAQQQQVTATQAQPAQQQLATATQAQPAQQQQAPTPQAQSGQACPRCRQPATFVPQYNKYYCYTCKQYL